MSDTSTQSDEMPDEVELDQHLRLVNQPWDRSCLFESLFYAFGLYFNHTIDDAMALRIKICEHMKTLRHEQILHRTDGTLEQHIRQHARTSLDQYVARMTTRFEWGSALEIACFVSMVKIVNVHVYISMSDDPACKTLVRFETFDASENKEECPTVKLLYRGRGRAGNSEHYDALEEIPPSSADNSVASHSSRDEHMSVDKISSEEGSEERSEEGSEEGSEDGDGGEDGEGGDGGRRNLGNAPKSSPPSNALKWVPGESHKLSPNLFHNGDQFATYDSSTRAKAWTPTEIDCVCDAIKVILLRTYDSANHKFLKGELVPTSFKQDVYDEFLNREKHGYVTI